MITLETVEKALTYLGETDYEYAFTKSNIEFSKHLAKVAHAQAFTESLETTVPGRTASATLNSDFQAAVQSQRDAVYDHELIRAKRLRAELTIDVWRSINSARGKGLI